MDTTMYAHILAIAEQKSISKAADQLFITRSALNRQLLSLEQEIGAPLFKRIYNSLELTDIGKIYINAATQICGLIKECDRSISDHLATYQDKIFVGVTSGHSKMMLADVLNDFHQRYPDVTVDLSVCNSNEQRKQLAQGKIDIGIITLPDVTSEFQYEILDNSEVLLLTSENHPLADRAGLDENGEYRQCELSWFADDYFGLETPNTPLRHISEKVFFASNFKPKIMVDNSGFSLLLQFASAGSCFIINSEKCLDFTPSLVGFGLNPRIYLSYVVAYRNGYDLSEVERCFVKLVRKYYPA